MFIVDVHDLNRPADEQLVGSVLVDDATTAVLQRAWRKLQDAGFGEEISLSFTEQQSGGIERVLAFALGGLEAGEVRKALAGTGVELRSDGTVRIESAR